MAADPALRETLSVILFAAVALALLSRMARARWYLRLALAPVVAVAAVRALALAVYFLARGSGHSSGLADALGWAFVLSLPTITLAFALGMTAYILVAIVLEERDLLEALGAPYADYRRKVPMLLPRLVRRRGRPAPASER